MAGAGKRTFIAGEVLTAAQVNDYLMDQSVMRFSGSAARAASITVPTEGMVTYLDDSNVLEYYDGSVWVTVATANQVIGALATASAQMFVTVDAGSVVALDIGTEGQVLTVDGTSSVGMSWETIQAGGAAVYLEVAATGVTALPNALTAGFYQITTSASTSWSDSQFRFVDANENLFGVTLTNGAGFFTIPTTVASLNITTVAAPFTVLIQEIQGVTATLLEPPSVTAFDWTRLNGGSFTLTTASNAASIGSFDVTTGAFTNIGNASLRDGASIVSYTSASLGQNYAAYFVQSNPSGVWSTGGSVLTDRYPFQVFTSNGTFDPPVWSDGTVDTLVVAGGGGGGNSPQGGGGGGGGASLHFGVSTPGPLSVTVGAGGAAATAGSSSSFGAFSNAIGGGGGSPAGGGSNPQTFAGGTPAPNGAGGGGGMGTAGKPGALGAGERSYGGDGTNTYGYVYGAGGGGGGANHSPVPNTLYNRGGQIGGGDGQIGSGGRPAPQLRASTVGAANRAAGGGGGAEDFGVPNAGKAGGSGIVIVKVNEA